MLRLGKYMDKKDVSISIICGLAVSLILADFLPRGQKLAIISIFFILPALAVSGLYIAEWLGKKWLFLHQAGKFALAGAFADAIDIKAFQVLILIAPFSIFFKSVSFLIATAVKYLLNKKWAFSAPGEPALGGEQHNYKEIIQFILITCGGLAIDVAVFYFLDKISTGLSPKLWSEAGIIIAALTASVWNFLGYKFLVFNK